MAFIIVAGICACLYFLFLCFMVFQVFRNISCKRSSLPAMTKARRLHYEVRSYFRQTLVWNNNYHITIWKSFFVCFLFLIENIGVFVFFLLTWLSLYFQSNLHWFSNFSWFLIQGLIFRFKFLMLVTLACAAMTVIFFIISQVCHFSLWYKFDFMQWLIGTSCFLVM